MKNRNLPDDVTDADIDAYMDDPEENENEWLNKELDRQHKCGGFDMNQLNFKELKGLVESVEEALDNQKALDEMENGG